jgi:hypothetical protein
LWTTSHSLFRFIASIISSLPSSILILIHLHPHLLYLPCNSSLRRGLGTGRSNGTEVTTHDIGFWTHLIPPQKHIHQPTSLSLSTPTMARQARSPNTKSKPQMPAIPKDAPKLTKESFEKELQALKAKAQEETWARWAKEQAWVLIQSATLLSLAAIYSNVSQLTLSPIYGSIPAGIWHSKGVMAICFLGWSSNLFLKRRLPVKPVQLLPLIAAFIPMVQFFVFKISGTLGARFGPLIVESVTFFPLLLLSVSSTATILDDLEMSPGRFQWLSDGAPGVVSYAFFKGMEYFWKNKIQSTIGSTLVHTRLGLQIVLTGLYSIFAPSKLLLYAWPALLHTALLNTHVPVPYHTGLLNGTLNASGWSLIDRQESLTGYISVLESKEQHFRVMRCDHSLLGGEWLIHKSTHNRREPIYGVFVMLEAVRLVEVPNPVPDKEASALVMYVPSPSSSF